MERKKRKWKRRKANPFTEAGLLKTREVISELEKAINQPSNSNLLLVLQHLCVRVLRHFSCVRFFVTPWTVAQKAPLSMRFSMQKYWSGLPFPTPGDLPDPETELSSPSWQAGSLPLSHQGSPVFGNSHLLISYLSFTIQLKYHLLHKKILNLLRNCSSGLLFHFVLM